MKFRISNPEEAVNDWRLYRAAGRPPIWPIPAGFQWINGTLGMVDPLVGRDVQDALPAGTGQRSALELTTNGTERRVINGTSRSGVPQLPTGRSTEHGGTRDAIASTEHGGTHGGEHGTAGAGAGGTRGAGGTQDVPQNGRRTDDDQVDIDAKLLRRADLALIVMEWFDGSGPDRPHWRTSANPPAARPINAVIDAYRKRTEGPGGKFNSLGIAGDVRKLIDRIRQQPALEDVVRLAADGFTPDDN